MLGLQQCKQPKHDQEKMPAVLISVSKGYA